MSAWKRLYLVVEGQTEQAFVHQALQVHLANYQLELKPRIIVTSRKLGKRGGVTNYGKFRNELRRLLSQEPGSDAFFTTFIDFYALPSDFPGWDGIQPGESSIAKVFKLQKAMAADLVDPRFIPYLQLHEFEALLFCNLDELEKRLLVIPNVHTAIAKLKAEVGNTSPEEINDGSDTAPSKSIIRHIPQYKRLKVSVGAVAAASIELSYIRSLCPVFSQWVNRLENLGTPQ